MKPRNIASRGFEFFSIISAAPAPEYYEAEARQIHIPVSGGLHADPYHPYDRQ
jgi:hypothetical protein